MPEYLWTARLETAAQPGTSASPPPKPWPATAPTAATTACWGPPTVVLLFHPFPPGGEVNENDSYYLVAATSGRKGCRCRRSTPIAGKSSG